MPAVAAVLASLVLLAGCDGGTDPAEPDPPTSVEDVGDGADAGGADEEGEGESNAEGAEEGGEAASEDAANGDADGDGWDAELVDWPATRVTVETESEAHELLARIAAEPADRRQGLMGVEHLPDDAGMLFAFPEDRDGGFWMKDTLVPLDIAFTDPEGTIVAIEHMVPCEEDPCPTYEPGTEYRVALEVPGGWFEERDVEVGDRVSWDHLPEAS
jgi:uncharacterized protein